MLIPIRKSTPAESQTPSKVSQTQVSVPIDTTVQGTVDGVPLALKLRIFLPVRRTNDTVRIVASSVLEPFHAPRSKLEIALHEVDRVTAQHVRFGLMLLDAGYGLSASFRQGLSAPQPHLCRGDLDAS